MPEVLAKSNGTRLRDHVKDLLWVFEELQKVIRTKDLQDVADLVRYAAICHDFGKAQPAFQVKRLGNRSYQPIDLSVEIPHSLASLFFVNFEALREKVGEEILPLFLAVVAFHHFRKDFPEYLFPENARVLLMCRKLLEEEELREKILANLREELPEYQELIGFNRHIAEALQNGLSLFKLVPLPYLLEGFPTRIGLPKEHERLFIFLGGFLERCDHFASFIEEQAEERKGELLPEKQGPGKEKLWEKIEKALRERAGTNRVWQSEYLKGREKGNLILVAPTGYGKTEFAFLWSGGQKIFYTLPLRVAVNDIYRRAGEIWNEENEENVGLLHSDADLFFEEMKLAQMIAEENANVRELSRQLSLPACVATGDQFFPYALRPPGYERIYATFSYSCLVIDEVQAYDPKAAAIVVKFTEDVVKMGGRFLLMTATLPEFVREEIEKRTNLRDENCVNLYKMKKTELSQIRKHYVQTLPEMDENSLVPRILEEARRNGGQRVLVVLNTVPKAQEVYKKLLEHCEKEGHKDLQGRIWLVHSRFTLEDRREKEEFLKKEFKNPKDSPDGAKILVATQVVEASLDIDADVLFTELAPMDALVQRMGRVLRRIGPQCVPCGNGEYETPKGQRYKVPEGQPNVYIFLWKGEKTGTPYDKELLQVTAKVIRRCLKKRSQSPKNTAPSRGKAVKDSKELVLETGEGSLAEYEKCFTVLLFYRLVKRRCRKYLEEFEKTLSLLDAGYTSAQKREAQRVFRDIADVFALPEHLSERFYKDVLKFFEEKSCEGRRPSFVEFKKAILSRYFVSINPDPRFVKFYSLRSLFPEIPSPVEEVLEHWLGGIFIAKGKYDSEVGFQRAKESTRERDNVL